MLLAFLSMSAMIFEITEDKQGGGYNKLYSSAN